MANGRDRIWWAAWPGYVFIVGGVIYLAMGESAGLFGIGAGLCIVLLVWWFGSRRSRT